MKEFNIKYRDEKLREYLASLSISSSEICEHLVELPEDIHVIYTGSLSDSYSIGSLVCSAFSKNEFISCGIPEQAIKLDGLGKLIVRCDRGHEMKIDCKKFWVKFRYSEKK